MNREQEVASIKRKLRLGLLVGIAIFLPFFLFFYNKFNQEDSRIVKEIKKQETFFLYIKKNGTNNEIKNELKKQGITYREISSNKDYSSILLTLDLSESDVVPPAIIYIEKGQVVATLNEIEGVEVVKAFVENYKGGEQ